MANQGEHLMDLRTTFEQQVKDHNFLWLTLEQDYILSWILYGIAHTDELRGKIVFKGGTALKKMYYGIYRFSEDLDFTALPGAPTGEALERAIRKACKIAENELRKRIPNPIITCKRYKEKHPHPHGQEAFVIRAQLPWHGYPYVRVMIEITRHQIVVNPPELLKIIHNYPENLDGEILTFTLDEIFAEKLHAIYNNIQKVHEQTRIRSRVRDYYDLWRLLGSFQDKLDHKNIKETLLLKCENIAHFTSSDDFFDDKLLAKVQEDWDDWLVKFIYPIPAYEQVLSELREELITFLKWS